MAYADATQSWLIQAHAALTASNFEYKEFSDTGRLLDQESGVLPGIGLAVELSNQDWFVEGEVFYYSGAVTYDGQTNLGAPITTNTQTTRVNGLLNVGHRLVFNDGPRITPYLGIAYHYWDRDILPTSTTSGNPVSGLHEIYRWNSFNLGVRAQIATRVPGLWLGLDLQGFLIKRPSMELVPGNGYDGTMLSLGEETGWRLGLPIDYAMNKTTMLQIEFYAESWGFGRSATQAFTSGGIVVGSIYEPRSETSVYGFMVGLTQKF